MNNFAIFTSGISKTFNDKKAVSDVDLKISSGEIYALIGPNGAGKTTLIKMLVGLLNPTNGKILIYDKDIVSQPTEAKKLFGYVSDNPIVYDFLTGYEFLTLTGSLRGLSSGETKKRINELSGLFPIQEIINQKMGSYSRGNRQKVAFLAAILAKPKLLIIDEPIAGLDPTSITILGQTLKKFANDGGAVLLATHILSFGQFYANKVGVMYQGKIHKEETTSGKPLEEIYMEATHQ